ncbi:methionine/alanine import family NSS transporter small subunit [Sutcliffiella deserti]|nr:methionine/alanine import family NSS transporter small subunit [Sutcliffiella deserti]
MDASAIIMMVLGIVILWGGLGVSIYSAVKKSKQEA